MEEVDREPERNSNLHAITARVDGFAESPMHFGINECRKLSEDDVNGLFGNRDETVSGVESDK
jgi:hypothetical protein